MKTKQLGDGGDLFDEFHDKSQNDESVKPTTGHDSVTDQNLDNIINLLMSVGAKGCLDGDDRSAFAKKDWINRRHEKHYH